MSNFGQFSLNQVEHTCRKAARGSGFAWGMADDIGKAIRWLAAYRLPAVEVFVEYLETYDDQNYHDVAPTNLTSPLEASGGVLNPLITGMALSDCFDLIQGQVLATQSIDWPILAVGFLGQTALAEEQTVALGWDGVELVFYRDAVSIKRADEGFLEARISPELWCRRGKIEDGAPVLDPVIGSIRVDFKVWERLEALAHHTYVEATDASRTAGAGAGLNDND